MFDIPLRMYTATDGGNAMIRKISLALLLCVLLAALYGCASPQAFNMPTQAPPGYGSPTATPDPTAVPQGDTEVLGDPMGEEGIGEGNNADVPQDVASVETYAFAGSTPLPLVPIDMPTPTPHPALTFSYETYEATKLGLKFDGPVGWTRDDSVDDTFTITEPEKRDNYTAFITIRKVPVSKDYNQSDMVKEVEGMMDTIKSTNFTVFKPSNTDTRTLMDNDGVYANYEGTLVDGTRVRGRVHVTCIDKVLYSIHMSHPAGYNSDYLKIHGKIRDTMTLTK
jgi:hypothetical protein